MARNNRGRGSGIIEDPRRANSISASGTTGVSTTAAWSPSAKAGAFTTRLRPRSREASGHRSRSRDRTCAFLTDDEENRLIAVLPAWLKPLVIVAIHTACAVASC